MVHSDWLLMIGILISSWLCYTVGHFYLSSISQFGVYCSSSACPLSVLFLYDPLKKLQLPWYGLPMKRYMWQRAKQGFWSISRKLTELFSWKVHEKWNSANTLANEFGNIASLVKYPDNTEDLAVRLEKNELKTLKYKHLTDPHVELDS